MRWYRLCTFELRSIYSSCVGHKCMPESLLNALQRMYELQTLPHNKYGNMAPRVKYDTPGLCCKQPLPRLPSNDKRIHVMSLVPWDYSDLTTSTHPKIRIKGWQCKGTAQHQMVSQVLCKYYSCNISIACLLVRVGQWHTLIWNARLAQCSNECTNGAQQIVDCESVTNTQQK